MNFAFFEQNIQSGNSFWVFATLTTCVQEPNRAQIKTVHLGLSESRTSTPNNMQETNDLNQTSFSSCAFRLMSKIWLVEHLIFWVQTQHEDFVWILWRPHWTTTHFKTKAIKISFQPDSKLQTTSYLPFRKHFHQTSSCYVSGSPNFRKFLSHHVTFGPITVVLGLPNKYAVFLHLETKRKSESAARQRKKFCLIFNFVLQQAWFLTL